MAISDNARGVIYMNLAMLAFTLNDTAVKAVTHTLPLFQAIALRGLLATAALAGMALMTGAHAVRPDRRGLGIIGLRTLAEIGGTVLFLAALTQMPLANLSAIMQSMPLAVTLGAAVVFKDRVTPSQLIAILVGLVGVLLIVRPGPEGFDIWALMGLASVGCVMVRDLATRAVPVAVPSVLIAVAASGGVTLVGLAGTLVTGWQAVTAHEALLLIGAAAFLVVGYYSVVRTMRVGDIGVIAPFRYTALLWALVLGWLTFGALPDPLTLLGAGIVVATGIFTLYDGRRARLAIPLK